MLQRKLILLHLTIVIETRSVQFVQINFRNKIAKSWSIKRKLCRCRRRRYSDVLLHFVHLNWFLYIEEQMCNSKHIHVMARRSILKLVNFETKIFSLFVVLSFKYGRNGPFDFLSCKNQNNNNACRDDTLQFPILYESTWLIVLCL